MAILHYNATDMVYVLDAIQDFYNACFGLASFDGQKLIAVTIVQEARDML